MGAISIWHWLIVLIAVGIPLYFIFKGRPEGENRFGDVAEPREFTEAIASFFRNYVNFSGRASRSEFWYSILFLCIVSGVLSAADQTGNLDELWFLATVLPSLAVTARRLHDTNRSGWLQLLVFCPPVGTIALIVWCCQRPAEWDIAKPGAAALGPAGSGVASCPVGERYQPRTKAASEVIVTIDALERLAKLKDSGAITQEEFEAEKQKIFGR